MNFSKASHRRHHSASSSQVLRPFQRAGSSDSMLLSNSGCVFTKYSPSSGRKRPGSESDVLEAKGSEVSLHHQDSLMLAYHQRPSVIAGHGALSVSSSAPFRQTKPVYVWTQNEVCKWLKKHVPPSQAQYADVFMQHDITGKTLLMLNESKLQRMGIKEASHRNNIQNEILKLQMKNYMQCFKGLQSAGMFDIQ